MRRLPAYQVVAACVLALGVGFTIATLIWPGTRIAFWTSTILLPLVPMLSGVIAIRQARKFHGRARQSWTLIGAGVLTWGVGSLTYNSYEVVLHQPVPMPGPPDLCYISAAVLVALGISRYPTLSTRTWSFTRAGIDTLLIVFATVLVGWVLAIGPAFEGGGDFAANLTSLIPTAGDIVVIAMVLLLLGRTPTGGRAPLTMLLGGMTMVVAADTIFAMMSVEGRYSTGDPIDSAWWAGLFLVGCAACAYQEQHGPAGDLSVSRREILIPYLVAVTAVGLGALRWSTGHRPGNFEMALIAFVLVLLLARQTVAAIDSIDLARELHFSAYHDPLTELPNRRSLQDRIATLAQHSSSVEAILMIDLDGFKEVNDSLGHEAGDALLRETARRLSQAVRGADVLARIGGDEFAVVLMAGSDPVAASERLLARIREPYRVAGTPVSLSASIGIAPVGPGTTGEELLRNADLAMYRAKGSGRDRASMYLPHLHQQARERMALHNALHEAVDRGDFRLLYQPIVEIATGRIRGVEGLIRWHRHGRLLPPSEFLPMLSDSGLIITVGDWSLDRACSDLATWRAQGHNGLDVAVNLASRQLCDPDLPARVEAILNRRGIPAHLLTLEITEAVILDDEQTESTVRATLEALSGLGVQLALDDFGTGYASLTALRTVPVNTIKVDRSFIAELDTGGSATVDGIAYLAHRYNLNVIAEGVETEAQRERLRDTGIRMAQGYLFAPPLEASDIARRLAAQADAIPQAPAPRSADA